MKRIGLLAVTLTMLAACGSPMEHHLAKTAEQDCNWLRSFADLPACNTYVAPKKLAPEPAIHCYRTIGAVECHTQEIYGWAEVGSS